MQPDKNSTTKWKNTKANYTTKPRKDIVPNNKGASIFEAPFFKDLMERPKIKIKLTTADVVIELIGFIGLILMIGLPLYFFDQLPETIPRHYGANGEPDGFSGKGIIWTLPAIGLVLYLGMYWLNKYPHSYNYPQKVTEENAERLYSVATKMIRTLNAIITCMFAYITFATIQTALGNQSGLGKLFLPISLLLTFGVLGYFTIKSTNKQ